MREEETRVETMTYEHIFLKTNGNQSGKWIYKGEIVITIENRKIIKVDVIINQKSNCTRTLTNLQIVEIKI